jgi:hypothetical protein
MRRVVHQPVVVVLSNCLPEMDEFSQWPMICCCPYSQWANKHEKIELHRHHQNVSDAQRNGDWKNRKELPTPSPRWINQQRRDEEKLKVRCQIPSPIHAEIVDVGVGRDVQQGRPPESVTIPHPTLDCFVKNWPRAKVLHERHEKQEKEKQHGRVAEIAMEENLQDIELLAEENC